TAGFTIFLCLIPSHSLINNGYFSIYAYTSCVLTLFSVVCFLGLVTFHRFLLYKFNDMTKYNPFFSDKSKVEKAEAYLGCVFRTVQKVLKYAAFDIFKEALSMRIDSTYRAIFKGVYDGQINKLGKATGALLTIIMNVFYKSKDITESSTLIFLGALTFALFWFIPTYILIKKFNKSNASNTNIEPGWKGGKPLF
ncbi:ADP ATP carrier, partial [Tubulinosema ratisbonensis]